MSEMRSRADEISFGALHVVLPIVAGAFIYITWRGNASLNVFSWLDAVGLGRFVLFCQQLSGWLVPADWFIYSLPDALWTYAITVFYLDYWKTTPSRQRIPWLAIGPLLAIGGELGQAIGLVPGTFDFVDLFACCLAVGLALITLSQRLKRSCECTRSI